MPFSFHKINKITVQKDCTTAVYNLRVSGKEEYFAEGVLVHNCAQCPSYQTNGFVPVSDVVPIGVACTCRANCRCIITYRFAPDFNPLQSRTLSEEVALSSVNATEELS